MFLFFLHLAGYNYNIFGLCFIYLLMIGLLFIRQFYAHVSIHIINDSLCSSRVYSTAGTIVELDLSN